MHAIFLDGLYAPDRDGKGFMFHPAPAATQQDIEAIVARASKRILRFLVRRGVSKAGSPCASTSCVLRLPTTD